MNAATQIATLKERLDVLTGHARLADQRSAGIERGREADHPLEIPARGWTDVAWRSWTHISDNNIFLAAGGVTYAVLLSLFPGLAALISVYGLVLDPAQIAGNIEAVATVLPGETRQLLFDELHQLISTSNGTLGLAAGLSLVLALWSASRGMSGLLAALNMSYGQQERRSFVRFNALALLLTLGLMVGGVVAISLVAVLPAAVQFVGISSSLKWLLLSLEWPLLAVFLILGLSVLYRVGPDRATAQWRWVSPGALVATLLWIAGSVGFSAYVANFGSYDKTYGSLGAVAVLLTWLYLSAFVVLLGGVINAQSERQTRRDSTVGPPKPMGQRKAWAADTLGATLNETRQAG